MPPVSLTAQPVVEELVQEIDFVDNFFVFSGDTRLDISRDGAWAIRARNGSAGTQDTGEAIIGAVNRTDPASVLLLEGTVGGLDYNEIFVARINDNGTLAHSGQYVSAGGTGNIDVLFVDQTPLIEEGDPVTAPGLSGETYTSSPFALIDIAEDDTPLYEGRYGGGSALFRGPNVTVVQSGDMVNGLTITDFTNTRASTDGSFFITRADTEDTGGPTPVAGPETVLLNQTPLLTEDDLIGLANGALDASETFNDLRQVAVNNSGEYVISADTSAGTHVVFSSRDGIFGREGGQIDGLTIAPRGVDVPVGINNDGDVVALFDNALILNDTLALTVGFSAVGKTDVVDDFNLGLGITDRYIRSSDGLTVVDLYFGANNDFGVDGYYRYTAVIPEPAVGLLLLSGLFGVLNRQPRVRYRRMSYELKRPWLFSV